MLTTQNRLAFATCCQNHFHARLANGLERVIDMALIAFIFSILLAVEVTAEGQFHDFRCKCICPSPQVVTNDTILKPTSTVPLHPVSESKQDRLVYIDNVRPQDCNCDGVVLPQLKSNVQDKAKEFCPRCECKYESRNITTIRWVVSLIIGIIVCLVIYMGFLMLLDPLLHKGARRSQYEQQVDDDQTEMRPPVDEIINSNGRTGSTSSADDDSYTQFNSIIRSESNLTDAGPSVVVSSGSVLNRAVQHTNKWKKQVQEQRKNIYDDHSMLN